MTEDDPYKVHDPLLDRPDFAAALGMIVSQSSYMETQLAELFCEITGTDPQRGEILYWSYPTFNQRRRIMETILERTNPSFEQRAAKLIERAKEFINFRNSSVHDLWIPTESGSPIDRMVVNKIRSEEGEVVRVKLKQMKDRISSAIAINSDLARLILEIQRGAS